MDSGMRSAEPSENRMHPSRNRLGMRPEEGGPWASTVAAPGTGFAEYETERMGRWRWLERGC